MDKQRGGIVAMAGDSITDSEVLKKANVGLVMGSGCDVAKDNSDLIILDNNFASILKSILWGRAIFDNIKKFLQFQLTMNLVICFVHIIGGATIGHHPLNCIQLLWTNLIMDVLGAIAIGTEPYKKDGKFQKVEKKRNRKLLLLDYNWRQILVQATYQILVMCTLMFAGNYLVFEADTEGFSLYMETRDLVTQEPTPRLVLDTVCFHAFILMNLFNQINCRVLDSQEVTEWNVFRTLNNNIYFWLVFAFELFLQHMFIAGASLSLMSSFAGTAPLTTNQTVICWVLGINSLAVNYIVKRLKIEMFFFTDAIDLEHVNYDERINRIYRSIDRGVGSFQALLSRKEEHNETFVPTTMPSAPSVDATGFENILDFSNLPSDQGDNNFSQLETR